MGGGNQSNRTGSESKVRGATAKELSDALDEIRKSIAEDIGAIYELGLTRKQTSALVGMINDHDPRTS